MLHLPSSKGWALKLASIQAEPLIVINDVNLTLILCAKVVSNLSVLLFGWFLYHLQQLYSLPRYIDGIKKSK